MVKRLGLDKESATPTLRPVEADAKSTVSARSGRFKTPWVLATLVVIAIAATVLFYQKADDRRFDNLLGAQPPRIRSL
jgi:hypothetical protein